MLLPTTFFSFCQEATEEDIREYFATFGEVSSVNLKMDPVTGRSRGFAFIVFSAEEVLTAILQQDHAIKGKKVAVKKAASKQARFRSPALPIVYPPKNRNCCRRAQAANEMGKN